jgi:hypothetical protein
VIVPGYPVYYAPSVRANYFFDDGLYWVFNVEDGYWYSSSWYNGPWVYVEPAYVPQSILVVPYRYYRVRPEYWSGWQDDLPPRWGHQWGGRWESSRRGWDHWDHSRTYVAAPLPLYQKRYDRDHYPAPSQQVIIHNEQYHYQPQDVHVRQRHAAILQEQSKGGAKARGKAEGVEKTRHREKAQPQEKGQSPQHREKAQQQDKAHSPQHREKVQQQDKAQSPQHREKAQPQDKAQSPQHREKVQQQEKGQSAQHREKAQQEKGQSQQGHEGTKRQKKGQDQEKGQEEAP